MSIFADTPGAEREPPSGGWAEFSADELAQHVAQVVESMIIDRDSQIHGLEQALAELTTRNEELEAELEEND